jgi:hypothetical protein
MLSKNSPRAETLSASLLLLSNIRRLGDVTTQRPRATPQSKYARKVLGVGYFSNVPAGIRTAS